MTGEVLRHAGGSARVARHGLLAFAMLMLLAWATVAMAQVPVQRLSQYGHAAWRTQDGLVVSPNSIAQTKDGYFWIGTNTGLVRFDGVRFAVANNFATDSVARGPIDTVFAASDGSLWIATNQYIARIQNGAISTYKVPGRPLQFLEDDTGTIWFAQTRASSKIGSVCSVTKGQVRCHGEPEFARPYSSSLSHAKGGGFWVGAIGALCRWTPGSPTTCYLTEQLKPHDAQVAVNVLETSRDGQVWVGIGKAGVGMGLGRLELGQWKPFTTPELDGSAVSVSSLLEDKNGSLWIGTANRGLYRIHAGRAEHFGRTDGLTSDSVIDLREDSEGTVWVATSNGLDAFRPLPVSRFSLMEGLPSDRASTALPMRDGSVWIGGPSLSVVRNGLVTSPPDAALFRNANATALMQDHAGRVWIGLDKTLHVYQAPTLTPITVSGVAEIGTVTSLAETTEHDVWALVRGGQPRILRIRNLIVVEEILPERIGRPIVMAADPRGGLWLGYFDGAISFYRDKELRSFPPDAISKGRVNGLSVDSIGMVLAATSAGLLLQQADTRRLLNDQHGLPCSGFRSVVRDLRDAVWLQTVCGFIEIQGVELRRWWDNPDSKIRYRLLDVTDGAQPGESSFTPNAAVALDGRLWFANGITASVIDPAAVAVNARAPPVHIEELKADRVSYSPAGSVKLPEQTRDIEIRYTALSFAVPQKVKFQYQLEGRDLGWQDADTRRQAFYNDLPPGTYRFRVKACNNDGVWNETGASIDFEIPPFYYQTKWFAALIAVLGAGSLYGIYIVRLRQVAARLRDRLAAKHTERERIARDLHDTLLQSTQGLILRFQAASNRMPASDPTRQVLNEALERADEVLAEGRDRVLDLRVPADTRGDLATSLSSAGAELALGSSVAFRTTVEGRPRWLEPRIKDEAYSIGREALINAFRHAEAGSIEVQLVYADEDFRLRVRDDGLGIETEALEAGSRPGHWGLPGMRERAAEIKAQLTIWSRAGAGTEIEVRIPAVLAYGPRALRGGWLRRLLARR